MEMKRNERKIKVGNKIKENVMTGNTIFNWLSIDGTFYDSVYKLI